MKAPRTTLERLAAMARLYGRAAAMTERLVVAEKLPDEDTLDLILKQRLRLLERIARLDRELSADGPGKARRLTGLVPGQEIEANGLLEKIEEGLEKLLQASQGLGRRLEREKTRLAGELGRIRRGRKTIQAYQPFQRRVSYYVDRKS